MSVTTFDPNAPAVTLTTAAQRFFSSKIAAQPGKVVRLSTKASGCTGYAYVLDLVDEPESSDQVLTPSTGLVLAISSDAVGLVKGTEIDLVMEGVNEVIKFRNPNVVAECGCGESFSVN